MKYKTVLFDLDGTLLYTLGDLRTSLNHALRGEGLPERSIEEVRRDIGNGVARLIALSVPESADEELRGRVLSAFKEHYSVHKCDTTAPYDGVIPLLEELKKNGVRVGVVSNKYHSAAVAVCEKYFGDLVGFVQGNADGIGRKPCPDMVYAAMRALGAERESTLYVGDSEVDVLTAKNASLPCLSVCWGYRSMKELKEAGAKEFIKSPGELLKYIKS